MKIVFEIDADDILALKSRKRHWTREQAESFVKSQKPFLDSEVTEAVWRVVEGRVRDMEIFNEESFPKARE